jgi:hypothetical protein
MIFHGIFFVKSLTFILFHSIVMHYWHLLISNCDRQNFSVCCCTVLPLGNISKYFAIVKQNVICQIAQILTELSPSVRDPCLFNHLIPTMPVSVCLFVHVYVYPFVVVSVFKSVCFLIYLNQVCLSVCLSSHLHVCQSSQLDVFLSACLSAYLSISISVNLPNSVSVHLYVCQAVCQAVCLCGC